MKESFFKTLVEEWVEETGGLHKEIYEPMGLYRQQFSQLLRTKHKNISQWARFRRALGMNRDDFWHAAMNYFDPEEERSS